MIRRLLVLMSGLVIAVTSVSSQAPVSPHELANAARRDDVAAVRKLLDGGAKPDDALADGMTALHWAAYNDNAAIAALLLERGATVDPVTRNGGLTPLMVAASHANPSTVPLLLRHKASISRRSLDGTSVLMFAALGGSADIVTALLDGGANIDERDVANGLTPLMFAAAENRLDVVRVLIKRGADTKITSVVLPPGSRGRGPAPVPNAGPDRNAGRGPNAGPNAQRQGGPTSRVETPLSRAQAERRAPPRGLGGWTALTLAAREGHTAVAQAMVEMGANINEQTAVDKATPLITAIINGHYDMARMFIEHGADVNLTSDDGLAPLYAAIDTQFAPVIWQPNPPTDQEKTTYLDLMTLLLDRGADPNARLTRKLWFRPSDHDDSWTGTVGTTAFWRASFATDVAAMRLLVRRGADPKIPSSEGVTPLIAAAGLGWTGNQHRTVPGGWIPAAEFNLELGADVNARDQFGYSALHAAAFRGDNAMVKFLIEKGARLDGVTIFGDNVTDMANGFVAYGSNPLMHPETVKLLLSLGAPAVTPGERKYCVASGLNCPVVGASR
jgi:ankyrin repeat protein